LAASRVSKLGPFEYNAVIGYRVLRRPDEQINSQTALRAWLVNPYRRRKRWPQSPLTD
jgi:hypothetical protein